MPDKNYRKLINRLQKEFGIENVIYGEADQRIFMITIHNGLHGKYQKRIGHEIKRDHCPDDNYIGTLIDTIKQMFEKKYNQL